MPKNEKKTREPKEFLSVFLIIVILSGILLIAASYLAKK
ncbi:MAG: hypothetical protein UW39_C0001G0020 [Parcubacteria group bacterium GW2011_GWC2_44_17]|nr:MAG: hypothetical protein UW39_C0001G0020 [Parcubacteria group bacterium GW2011_GWC2_44_17]